MQLQVRRYKNSLLKWQMNHIETFTVSSIEKPYFGQLSADFMTVVWFRKINVLLQ